MAARTAHISRGAGRDSPLPSRRFTGVAIDPGPRLRLSISPNLLPLRPGVHPAARSARRRMARAETDRALPAVPSGRDRSRA